jgi:hypothetical protein
MFARPKCLINAECRVDRMGTDQDLLALPAAARDFLLHHS